MNPSLHTSKLFGLNVIGVLTWASEATNALGAFGALLAVLSGVMLLCIRMKDFLASAPVKWLARRDSALGRATYRLQVSMGTVPPWAPPAV